MVSSWFWKIDAQVLVITKLAIGNKGAGKVQSNADNCPFWEKTQELKSPFVKQTDKIYIK